jgi:(R,R)-butanediol dehydrogenase / meso-butanediol dehydrogenase / diacetyl reductase
MINGGNMSKQMNAAIYAGVGKAENIEMPVPVPKDGETLIKVESVGICGTDIAIYSGKHPRAKAPLVMGHEVGGVVAEISGKAAAGVEIGTRVTFFPLISCGTCGTCLSGRSYVCDTLKLIGIDFDGGMAEYVSVPSESVIPVPSHWNKNRAALMEPVAVAVHSVRRSSVKPGDRVLVLGAGIIGNLCAQMAKTAGAAQVVIADLTDYRLNIAAESGLTPVNIKNEDMIARAHELTGGAGFDVTLECSGSAAAQPVAIAATRVLGEIIIVGMPKEPPAVDLRLVAFKELSMIGSRVYEKVDFQRAIELVERERILVDNLISHEYPLEKTKEALDLMAEAGDSMKIILTV